MTTISGNINQQVVLQTPTYANPILVTGSILDPTANQAALFGSGIAWTITNQGVIKNTSTAGSGIQLINGGNLTNSGTAAIQGSTDGADGFTNVTNYGSILGGNGYGVQSGAGGTLSNAANALISGGYRGAGGGETAVSNAGVIRATQTNGTGLILSPANSVVTNTATIAGGYVGLFFSHAGTVFNTGTIVGTTGRGVFINSGGYVSNGANDLISGSNAGVMIFIYGAGTVTNAGTIVATGVNSTGASLRHGGYTTNASTGLIQGTSDGADGATSLSNYGTIIGTGRYGAQYGGGGTWLNAANAVISGAGGIHSTATLVSNAGLIRATGTHGSGVYLYGTIGSVVNSATIIAGYDGVRLGHAGTVINTGIITGIADRGILINAGGYVSNAAGKSISGANFGVEFFIYGNGTLFNAGTIVGTGTNGTGASLRAGGTFTNTITNIGLIQGGGDGADGATALTNSGTIIGTTGYAVHYGSGGTLTNAAGATITGAGGIHDGATAVSNAGLIQATATHDIGVHLYPTSGVLTNSATIVAGYDGVRFDHAGTVINTGIITGTAHNGIFIGAGGYVSNAAGKSITGASFGVQFSVYGSDTLSNSGTIVATAANSTGAFLQAGGTVTNAANALIRGNAGVVVYGTGAAVTNFGTIAAASGNAVYVGTNGRVIAEAGAVFSGEVAGNGNAHGSVMELASGIGGSVLSITNFATVQFDTGAQWTVAGAASQLTGTFTGFATGNTIDLTGFVAVGKTFGNNQLVLSDSASDKVTLGIQGSFTTGSFNTASDGGTGTDITVTCFCRGTLILTERGEVAVEALAVGDRVMTLSGAFKPIQWIGMGRDLVTRANKWARPVIVRQGALADNVPQRDLFLTHGHALYVDGVLIPVENLVNYRSIEWDETARVVEYYHIELEDHDVVFAEGAPAETYYDAGNRALFHNTRPGSAAGAAMPTFAPVLNGGDVVDKVWAALFERAGGAIETDTTDDADLHLVVNGERLNPGSVEGCAYTFAVQRPPTDTLRVCSRSSVPSLLGITRHDHRRLGAAINRIELRQAGVATIFEHEAPLFVQGGCHAPEGGFSWTDGEFNLPTRLFAHLTGTFSLIVHTERPGMRYPILAPLAQAA